VPIIRETLQKGPPQSRIKASIALWRIEKKSEEAVRALSALLPQPDPPPTGGYGAPPYRGTAGQAATALGEMGAEARAALPALRGAVYLGDESLYTNCEAAIRKIEAKQPPAR